jgi:hypothetical protein
VTQESRDRYIRENLRGFKATDDGLELSFFEPIPYDTDFLSHAIATEAVGGKEKKRYLF